MDIIPNFGFQWRMKNFINTSSGKEAFPLGHKRGYISIGKTSIDLQLTGAIVI